MSKVSPPPTAPDLGLIRRVRDEDDDEPIQKPLEWSLIRRLFTYAAPVKRKVTALSVLSVIRSAQLPAFAWMTALIINGPISRGDLSGLWWGVAGQSVPLPLALIRFVSARMLLAQFHRSNVPANALPRNPLVFLLIRVVHRCNQNVSVAIIRGQISRRFQRKPQSMYLFLLFVMAEYWKKEARLAMAVSW